ncbi:MULTISPECIES: LysE family translocator [unclassified Pseudoalteromonas]|uniref:LysE family translocator n=1 Tax=unclassified Pseudoalteromonas TaxID=194690 RepID=UPI000CF70C08|nr:MULTISPECIES: LysE family translocator [unclassified Pseudoalteromonas]MBS3798956.1 LysE family translocator [Pseudoalteromonas sp. BDTF-M6]
MNAEMVLPLAMFAAVSSLTPGPNNLMLMSSGANFGFRRTIPHMLGVSIGFCLMLVLVGLGVMQLFDLIPYSFEVLRLLCFGYLLYLAYKIFTSGEPSSGNLAAHPFTFTQAALFQWLNPKAWTMALSAVSVYAPTRDVYTVMSIGVIFALVNLPCVGSWSLVGEKLTSWLTSPWRLRVFNTLMATLLVLSVAPSLWSATF